MSEIQPKQERSMIAQIFLSPDGPRLRAGWRLLIQTLLMLLFGAVFGAIFAFLGILDLGSIWGQILNFIIVTGSVYVARRWLDNDRLKALA